ncbi:MAG: hypothetical protein IJ593_07250 [Lachnospiraceae bacterium]|nr:hypothetical protein [Lachnospiraceae bacterium]
MNIKKYLTMTCEWEPCLSNENSEFGLTFGDKEVIPCFSNDNGSRFGRVSFDLGDSKILNRSTRAYYVIDTRVKEGDRIDGQIVRSCDDKTDIRGRFAYKICGVV